MATAETHKTGGSGKRCGLSMFAFWFWPGSSLSSAYQDITHVADVVTAWLTVAIIEGGLALFVFHALCRNIAPHVVRSDLRRYRHSRHAIWMDR